MTTVFGDFDVTSFWDTSDYAKENYAGESLTDEMLTSVEDKLGYIGRGKRLDFMSDGPILSQMPSRAGEGMATYRNYIELGLAENDKEFEALMMKSPRSIGGDRFRVWVDGLHKDQLKGHGSVEDVSFRQTTEPLESSIVLGVLCEVLEVEEEEFLKRRRHSSLRVVAAKYLMKYSGLNQPEVGKLLNVGSGSAISKQLARFAAREKLNKRRARKLKKIEQMLDQVRLDRGI